MALDITSYLLSAQSHDKNIRTKAAEVLLKLGEDDPSLFLCSLSIELANDAKEIKSRLYAGVLLRNLLHAKGVSMKDQPKWMTIDSGIKSQIKQSLMRALVSTTPKIGHEVTTREVGHISAQVIAKIAAIEIPEKQWPDLISTLLFNISAPDSPASLKRATLETLEYVCEEISHEDLEQIEAKSVLTAVAQGMNLVQNTTEVCLAATKALYYALAFAQKKFDEQVDWDNIMKAVCSTATSLNPEIQHAAYECLVAIASMHYKVLEPYMGNLFELTSTAVIADQSGALQAIEFWISICLSEIAIQESYGEDIDQSEVSHSHFIQRALPQLVPILLRTLLNLEEDKNLDISNENLLRAGRTCLCLVARTVGDSVVPLVRPFLENKLSQEWHCRRAAIFAFGSSLDGLKREKLLPFVQSDLKVLLASTKDQNYHVRDATAWTLSHIFELLHSPASGFNMIIDDIQRVLDVLVESLKDAPNIAEKICGAIGYLVQGFKDVNSSSIDFTPYIQYIIVSLISTANRTDATDNKLRSAAFKSLTKTIRCAKFPDTVEMIGQLLEVILCKLSLSFDRPIKKKEQGDLQALLCGVLQVIIQKLNTDETKDIVIDSANTIMLLILKCFAGRSASVHEKAMLVVGALVYPTDAIFVRYMPDFFKYLQMGLQNHEEYQVCSITVGVIGDICRALKDKILPYCNAIISLLVKDLCSSELHHSVKPAIFSCFADIALAIGAQFEKYLVYVIPMMESASDVCAKIKTNDEEHRDLLMCSILGAYSGVLQCFKDAKPELFVPHAKRLLQFLEFVFRDKKRVGGVRKAAIEVLGNLVTSLGPSAKFFLNDCSFYSEFIQECLHSYDPQLKNTANLTREKIGRIMWFPRE